jgi:hypothetical protein
MDLKKYSTDFDAVGGNRLHMSPGVSLLNIDYGGHTPFELGYTP